MEHEVEYGRSMIKFSVNRRQRNSLAIHVEPSGKVVVDAPFGASDEDIAGKVKKRAEWILRQQKDFTRFEPELPERQYLSGEEFRYLGTQLRLQVSEGHKTGVRVIGKKIEVKISSPGGPQAVKAQLDTWLRRTAEELFDERLVHCFAKVGDLGLKTKPILKIRKMEKRWGSCTNGGVIILNPKLLEAPIECIDYVVIHELCHLVERNHSPKFYALLAKALPNWKMIKQTLNEKLGGVIK